MIKNFLAYFGVRRYINLLFSLLFLFLIAILFYKINLYSHAFKQAQFKSLEAFSKELDFSLKEKIDAISYLDSTAQFLFRFPSSQCSDITSMVHQVSDKDYYAIDGDYNQDFDIRYRTNLTGYGDLKAKNIDSNELCMALSLNRFFNTISNQIKDSAWIYYTSKTGFINLFPYVHSDIFHLKKGDMLKECYTYGTPAFNPNKEYYWTPLYVDAGGLGLMVSLGKPLYVNGDFKGVVAFDMTLEHLKDLLKKFKGGFAKACLVNKENELLSTVGISPVSTKKVTRASTVLSKEILALANTHKTLASMGDYFVYKKRLTNAPWEFIDYFDKSVMYKDVFFKVLAGILIFIFILFARVLVEKIIATQKELEHLNNTLEEKVQAKIAELDSQKSNYETLFERAGSGMCILKDAKILECNNAFMRMLGVEDKEDLLGHYILEFSPKVQANGEKSLKSARKFQRALIKQGEQIWEWQGERRDGLVVWMEIVSKIITLEDEKVVQIIAQDITKRKKLEEENREQMNQLLQQSRLAQMGEMLSMISHQWRQPLSSIAMVVMNLEVKVRAGKLARDSEEASQKSDAFILERTKRIEKYVQYLASTIDDFRNFFKPQKEKKTFKVNKLIEETIELIRPTLDSKNISLKRSYQNLEHISSYENEIKQVILNILNNAKDAILEKEISNPLIMIGTYA